MDYIFGVVSKKSSPHLRSYRFSAMLPFFVCFLILYYICRPMVQFELVFLKRVKSAFGRRRYNMIEVSSL